jgi:hypothetical protein
VPVAAAPAVPCGEVVAGAAWPAPLVAGAVVPADCAVVPADCAVGAADCVVVPGDCVVVPAD